jgi:protein-S-isoprenylcysteine O-methyltransferase Ste14
MLPALGDFFFRWRNALFAAWLLLPLILAPWPLRTRADVTALLAGIVLVAAGQVLRIVTIGLRYIERGGRAGRVHASRLVTGGVFALTRNPMYLGNLLLAAGLLLVYGRPEALIIGASFVGLVYVAIVAREERFLSDTFGAKYADYCRRTPRWLPQLRNLVHTVRAGPLDWRAILVREYGTLTAIVLLLTALVLWRLRGQLPDPVLLTTGKAVAAAAAAFWIVVRALKKSRRLNVPR